MKELSHRQELKLFQSIRVGGMLGPDAPDERDHEKEIPEGNQKSFIDLRKEFPIAIRDQGSTNRCGGFTGASGLDLVSQKISRALPGMKPQRFSANDVYWWARQNRAVDSGVYMRQLMAGLNRNGAVLEKLWRDNKSLFARPDSANRAQKFRIPSYERIFVGRDKPEVVADNIMRVLSIEKLPLFIGAKMYADSTERAARWENGMFLPPKSRDPATGGHAMLVTGYRHSSQWGPVIILHNSWGILGGDNGTYYAPLIPWIEKKILTDCWTIGTKWL